MTRPAVLVLRALGLGDFLTGVPAYRALRAAHPDHEMVLAAPPVLAPVVELCGAFDRLSPTGELEPVDWPGPSPDVGVDLHGNGPASHDLVTATGARRLLMYGDGGPAWDDDEHEVHRWCRLLEWWGLPTDPTALRLSPPVVPAPVDDAVIVHPGAAAGSRRWPPGRFAAVAERLASAGERVVLTGTPRERPLAEEVAARAGLPAASVLAGRTGLAELAALVSRARLVVSNDTGVAHLGFAYARPSVTLYGPVSPALWGPPRGVRRHVVLWHGDGGRPGDAWGSAPDPRLLDITVEEVMDASRAALRQPT
ncbi:glycosyltransferase family 9 protein [Thermomonospora umbrina]|uniref:ADP-heptose:LPS heptosyltransferase n=1 Tax=Thermomonospora umbrina TaxID=111806 RepID=A0A3D9SZ06_9ACTN|nr:glycosyltransferase family 9 protein [Thermomonospora umbrina]REF01079.1 ADP-heptose:LPS heptosyltransferase [Thermomonospora umbrina]